MEDKKLSELIARKCQEADFDFVIDLSTANMQNYQDRYWGGWNDKVFREGIEKRNISIIEQDGKKVAFFDRGVQDDCLWLSNIQVVKEYQRQGIGRAMLGMLEEDAQRLGLDKAKVKIFVDNPAAQFFLKNGFAETGRKKDSLQMEKSIGLERE